MRGTAQSFTGGSDGSFTDGALASLRGKAKDSSKGSTGRDDVGKSFQTGHNSSGWDRKARWQRAVNLARTKMGIKGMEESTDKWSSGAKDGEGGSGGRTGGAPGRRSSVSSLVGLGGIAGGSSGTIAELRTPVALKEHLKRGRGARETGITLATLEAGLDAPMSEQDTAAMVAQFDQRRQMLGTPASPGRQAMTPADRVLRAWTNANPAGSSTEPSTGASTPTALSVGTLAMSASAGGGGAAAARSIAIGVGVGSMGPRRFSENGVANGGGGGGGSGSSAFPAVRRSSVVMVPDSIIARQPALPREPGSLLRVSVDSVATSAAASPSTSAFAAAAQDRPTVEMPPVTVTRGSLSRQNSGMLQLSPLDHLSPSPMNSPADGGGSGGTAARPFSAGRRLPPSPLLAAAAEQSAAATAGGGGGGSAVPSSPFASPPLSALSQPLRQPQMPLPPLQVPMSDARSPPKAVRTTPPSTAPGGSGGGGSDGSGGGGFEGDAEMPRLASASVDGAPPLLLLSMTSPSGASNAGGGGASGSSGSITMVPVPPAPPPDPPGAVMGPRRPRPRTSMSGDPPSGVASPQSASGHLPQLSYLQGGVPPAPASTESATGDKEAPVPAMPPPSPPAAPLPPGVTPITPISAVAPVTAISVAVSPRLVHVSPASPGSRSAPIFPPGGYRRTTTSSPGIAHPGANQHRPSSSSQVQLPMPPPSSPPYRAHAPGGSPTPNAPLSPPPSYRRASITGPSLTVGVGSGHGTGCPSNLGPRVSAQSSPQSPHPVMAPSQSAGGPTTPSSSSSALRPTVSTPRPFLHEEAQQQEHSPDSSAHSPGGPPLLAAAMKVAPASEGGVGGIVGVGLKPTGRGGGAVLHTPISDASLAGLRVVATEAADELTVEAEAAALVRQVQAQALRSRIRTSEGGKPRHLGMQGDPWRKWV